jgi:hypothetical protein
MPLNLGRQGATYEGENASEVSEGSSIDFDALSGRNRYTMESHPIQDGQLTAARIDSDQSAPSMHTSLANHKHLIRLGPDSLIPLPLKNIINKWCASKGPTYSLSRLPCLTKTDPKQVAQSSKGQPATWEYRDGSPLTARMYALEGTELRHGQQKILVVEGSSGIVGPFIISYASEGSTSTRVCFKKWIGLGGDKSGFEKDCSVVKQFTVQTQVPLTKQRSNRPQVLMNGTEGVAVDLESDTSNPRKRKRQGNVRDDSGILKTYIENILDRTLTVGCSKGISPSRKMTKTLNPVARRSKPFQPGPVVEVPHRTAIANRHILHALGRPPQELAVTSDIAAPKARATSPTKSWSQTVVNPDKPTNIALSEASKKLFASTARGKSSMAGISIRRNLAPNFGPSNDPPGLALGYKTPQKDLTINAAPVVPSGYKLVQNPALSLGQPSLCQDHTSSARATVTAWKEISSIGSAASMNHKSPFNSPRQDRPDGSESVQTEIPTAGYHHEAAGVMTEPMIQRSSVLDLKLAKHASNEDLGSTGSTIADAPHRTEAKKKKLDNGIRGVTPAVINHAIAPLAQVEKSDQNAELMRTTTRKHNSMEQTPDATGPTRLPTKIRKKLQLQHVVVKFNSAIHQEPPRIRSFTACDTVQKLFHQARTGDVFGRASEVRSGGKLLTVEFRGSGRLHDDVYLVNEDDEEDFSRMKSALLLKDWWTQVDDDVFGGGLLDVRDAK